MDSPVFVWHERLKKFPPAHLAYIIYRRLVEQGLKPTWWWLQDKIARRVGGFSPPRYSQVLPLLYVGGQHYRRGLDRMRASGIQAVVNMREESDDAQRGVALAHYLWLVIRDDHAPSVAELARGVDFIAAQIAAGRGVYVHCAAGVGRAPTMAAAYLVSTGMSASEAWETIRQGRPFIRPTPPQLEVIDHFARARDAASAAVELAMSAPAPVDVADAANLAYSLLSGGPMQERAQLVDERISGDPGISGDLTDDLACILLTWAREEIWRLVEATRGLDDEAAWAVLDPQVRVLRRHLRRIAQTSSTAENPEATLRSLLESPSYPVSDES